MGDRTTEWIRAEYVETLARETYNRYSPYGDWETVSERTRQRERKRVRELLDILVEKEMMPNRANWAVIGTDSSGDNWIQYEGIDSRQEAERVRKRWYPHDGRIAVSYATPWREFPDD